MILNEKQKETVAEAGKRLRSVLDSVRERIQPGVSAAELDAHAHAMITEMGDTPAFLNYKPQGGPPFPGTLCVSVNDEVVHGVPDAGKVIEDGDIVTIDAGLVHNGLYTDSAFTVIVGDGDDRLRELVEATRSALRFALVVIHDGNRVGDIGAAIETVALEHGFTIPPELGGHGIGTSLHEEPFIPNIGDAGKGSVLKEGMLIAVEPIFSMGADPRVVQNPGEMVYRMTDGAYTAHFEHTILVTKEAPIIITGPMW